MRPLVLLAALARQRLAPRDRRLILWFGPRGLSSLLLVLLPVFAGQPGSPYLFTVTCLVVLLSIVIHGASSMLVAQRENGGQEAVDGRQEAVGGRQGTEDGSRKTEDGGQDGTGRTGEALPIPYSLLPTPSSDRITIAELRALWEAGEKVVVLDARTERAFNTSPVQPHGVTRFIPTHVAAQAHHLGLPHDAWLVAFCA